MEETNQTNEFNEIESVKELTLTSFAKDYLKESAKWSKLLAIVGFVGIGLMVLAAVFMTFAFSALSSLSEMQGDQPFPGVFLGLLYLVFAAIYYFPVMYLYKYATNAKLALETNDDETLEQSLMYLKSHHKFLGILMVIVLSLYALIFAGLIFAGGLALIAS